MTNLKQVRPEDFDVLRLWNFTREGRLFIDETVAPTDRETVRKNVHAYVRRIDSLVTNPFRASIDALWDDIFCCDELMAMMMPKPKARKCRDFDKYGVMRIVGVLREKGVYEQYSDPQYDAMLETKGKDSSYRRYLSQGLENKRQLTALRHILKQFDTI